MKGRSLNIRVVVGTLGAMLALVGPIGCGGGDSTGSGPPLAKAEFIKQGDAICREGNEASQTEIQKFAKENGFGSKEPTKAQFEKVVTEVLVPNLERQTEELDALAAPVKDQGKIDAIVAALRETITQLEEDPSSLQGNVLAKPIQLEKAYGFKVCGGG